MLQKYDTERDEAQRDHLTAAMWGVKPKDRAPTPRTPLPSNGKKQPLTAQDIMRNYG